MVFRREQVFLLLLIKRAKAKTIIQSPIARAVPVFAVCSSSLSDCPHPLNLGTLPATWVPISQIPVTQQRLLGVLSDFISCNSLTLRYEFLILIFSEDSLRAPREATPPLAV